MFKLGTTISTIALGGVLVTGAIVTPAAAQGLPAVVSAAAASPMLSTAPAATPTAASARAALLASLPTLRQGGSGGEVLALQIGLNARGAHLSADGSFGALTTQAVKAFQRGHGLAADGLVGARTWNALVYADARGVFTLANPQLRPGQLWSEAAAPVGGAVWETLILMQENTTWVPKQPSSYSRYAGAQVTAIRELQRRSGISPSGIIGSSTTRELVLIIALVQEFGD